MSAAMTDVRLGLIGCGELGRVHAGFIAAIPEARFVAYADTVEASAQSMLRDFGGDYATPDADKLLNDERVDAVYICTRHDSHAALAIAAARAGKHILVEKPLAMTVEDCRAVADAVRETGVLLMPGFKLRFYPLVQKAREFIPQPQVLVGQMMDARWPDGTWYQDPVQGGGNIYAQGCHTADLLRYLAGSEPQRLWAGGGTMTHPGHPCIDQCVASVQFAGGPVAAWIQGDAALGRFTGKFFCEVFGGGRSVQLHDRFKKATFCDGDATWTEERPEEEGFARENRAFIDALLAGAAPPVGVHDGAQATRMVVAADRAIRTGEVQQL